MTLTKRTALITGASGGIGKAICDKLVSDGATPVFILGRDERSLLALAEELEERHWLSEVIALCCNVACDRDVKEAVDYAVWYSGRVDILVNAAGIAGNYALTSCARLEEWKQVFDVNFFGTFLTMKYVLPRMISLHFGKIINFSGGGDGPFPGFGAYSASKVAVARLTETVAEEVRQFGIDVNVVAPGPVKTKLFDEIFSQSGKEPPKTVEAGRVADLIAFLASEKSNGLTGKFLSACWDKWENITNPENWSTVTSDPDVFTLRRRKGELG